MYIKVDVEGFEPHVLRGMTDLLRSPQAPLLLSFEYAWGWSEVISRINNERKARCRWSKQGAWPASGCSVVPRAIDALGEPSLRSFVASLDRAGYAVYLLHSAGLVRVSGDWWDDTFELALAPIPIDCWHDVLAVRRGMVQRVLLRMFNRKRLSAR